MRGAQLRLKQVKCIDETDGFLGSESGSDEILLSGMAIDATGDTKKLGMHRWEGFNDGTEVNLSPPLVLTEFAFAADDIAQGKPTGYPRSYFVTFMLAEEDEGGFPEFVKTIYGMIRDWAVKKVTAVIGGYFGGALGAAIGYAVGELLGWGLDQLFNLFVAIWKDDPFRPWTSRCDISSPFSSFSDDNPTSQRWYEIAGHGGKYRLEYEWRLVDVPSVVGVFNPGTAGHAMHAGDWKGFTAKWAELSKSGQRLVDVRTYTDWNTRVFTGVYRAGSGGHHLIENEWSKFEASRKQFHGEGFHLVSVDTYFAGNSLRAVGAFLPGKGKEVIVRGDWDTFVAGWKKQSAAKLRLDFVTTYVEGTTPKFVGVFHEGTDQYYLYASEWANFVTKAQALHKDGHRMRSVATYLNGGVRMYVGAWRAGTQAQRLHRAANWDTFNQIWKSRSDSGWRLVSMGV